MSVVAAFSVMACSASQPLAPAPIDASTGQDASAEAAVGDASKPDSATCKLLQPYSSKNVVCNSCAQARCCVQVNGCLGDPRCNDDYVNCILVCALLPADAGGDASGVASDCVAKCGVDYPVGRAQYDTAIGCVDSQCASDCK